MKYLGNFAETFAAKHWVSKATLPVAADTAESAAKASLAAAAAAAVAATAALRVAAPADSLAPGPSAAPVPALAVADAAAAQPAAVAAAALAAALDFPAVAATPAAGMISVSVDPRRNTRFSQHICSWCSATVYIHAGLPCAGARSEQVRATFHLGGEVAY